MANNERERDRQKFISQTNEHTKDGQKVCNTAQLQFFDTLEDGITKIERVEENVKVNNLREQRK